MGGWMLVVGRWSSVVGRWSSATRRWSLVAAVIVLGLVPVARAFPPSPKAAAASEVAGLWETGTFSILGYDPDTGEVGGAVQSRVFSVGNGVLWAEANVGVVATQAIDDVGYGPKVLELLRRNLAPAAIVRQVWDDDPDPLPENWTKQGRQFAVMNAKGEYAAFTGPKATEWAGHKSGKFCTAPGNILAGPQVVGNVVAGGRDRQRISRLSIRLHGSAVRHPAVGNRWRCRGVPLAVARLGRSAESLALQQPCRVTR